MTNIKRQLASFDVLLLFLVIILCAVGIVTLSSVFNIQNPEVDRTGFYKQVIWTVSGLFILIVASIIDYQFICKWFILIYILNLGLLGVVLTMPTINNVARWIEIGPATIQPSEFTKIFMIIFLATIVDKYSSKINNIFILGFILLLIAVPVYLIKEQPSLSASLVTLFISVVILFVGNLSYIYFIGGLAIIVPVAAFVYVDLLRETPLFISKILDEYQIERILPIVKPDADPELFYHTNQSIQVLGSGQLGGKGIYNGVINQHASFLPNADNDFIFAAIGEQFGFIGCAFVLVIMLLVVLKCLLIAKDSATLLGRLIASGVAAMLAFQTFVNVGVATGIMPNTGMTLPFISAGGSSIWISMAAIGLVINVGMSKQKSIFEG